MVTMDEKLFAEALMLPEDFNAFYGDGMHARVLNIINDLAPTTRRDDWWSTNGPYEIIALHLIKSK